MYICTGRHTDHVVGALGVELVRLRPTFGWVWFMAKARAYS